jgi:hypothetical protein
MDAKRLVLVLILVFAGLNIYSQDVKEADVPAAVKTKFAVMYPNVTGAKWEMENGKYEAEFKENNVATSVLFDGIGKYIQTEVEIPVSSLPNGVNEYAAKNLAGKKINEACQITSSDGTVSYEAEIDKDDYIFDSNGNFVKKDSDSGDTEDEDKK